MNHFKKFSILYFIPTFLILTSCAFNQRRPTSISSISLIDISKIIETDAESYPQNAELCVHDLKPMYENLYNLIGSSIYQDMDDIKILDQEIQRSFETRLKIKEAFKNLEIKSDADKKCFEASADVFKALRYVEDYMIEMRMEKTENAPKDYVNMKGEFPYLLVNPKYKDTIKSYEDLRSGDVILSRGGAYSSAAIARIGESDYQFSHLSFVHRDLETNELGTSEAHIEIGSVATPFTEHLNEKNTRSVVFRYKDPEIAAKASDYMFKRILAATNRGKNIYYDFAMDYKDDSKLFCSEIISSGIKHELPNEDYIPKFKSHFQKGLVPFLNTIGIPVTNETISTLDVFSPGDIQFDPRFDLVMEWRNPKKLKDSRVKDFILTKLFDKMEKENYKVDPSFKMDVQSRTFWLMRRLPIVKKFVDKKFPLNMSPTQLEMFMALDKIGETLFKEVERVQATYDHKLTPKEIYGILDDFIKKDFEQYQAKKAGEINAKITIHKYFHPN